MRKQQLWTGIGASVGLMILILDGKTALEGAQDGINLCIRTVIPSLFPFFVLSILLTGAFAGISLPVLKPVGKLFSMPEGAESILICAFLGGYPCGAQCIAEAYRSGELSKRNAQRLLAYCSNAGPAFLFGMAGMVFAETWMPWALWFIHIFSAFLVSLFFADSCDIETLTPKKTNSVSYVMYEAVKTMALVCGWVILFRVVIAFANRWVLWMLPVQIQVIFTGLLELSNGFCSLPLIEDIGNRFIICSGMLAFGGLCVTMQTASVTKGLSMKYYVYGKLLQTLFSLILAAFVIRNAWMTVFLLIPLFLIILYKNKKYSRNPLFIGV